MKTRIIAVVLFLSILFIPFSALKAEVTVGFNFFFGQLAPYGNWVTVPSVGLVWYPSGVNTTWRPYLAGSWAWTDAGWTWVSAEPWGWATYHYGRWVYDPTYGWVWIPGAVWAPAWVSWYVGPQYIGWAPLPPFATFQVSPNFGVFVSFGTFLAPNVAVVAVPSLQNVAIIGTGAFVTNMAVVGGAVVDPGPNVATVERATGRTIARESLASRNLDPVQVRQLGTNVDKVQGKTLSVFRPSVTASTGHNTPLLKDESRNGVLPVGGKRLRISKSAMRGTTLNHSRTMLGKAVASLAVHQREHFTTTHGLSARVSAAQRVSKHALAPQRSLASKHQATQRQMAKRALIPQRSLTSKHQAMQRTLPRYSVSRTPRQARQPVQRASVRSASRPPSRPSHFAGVHAIPSWFGPGAARPHGNAPSPSRQGPSGSVPHQGAAAPAPPQRSGGAPAGKHRG